MVLLLSRMGHVKAKRGGETSLCSLSLMEVVVGRFECKRPSSSQRDESVGIALPLRSWPFPPWLVFVIHPYARMSETAPQLRQGDEFCTERDSGLLTVEIAGLTHL